MFIASEMEPGTIVAWAASEPYSEPPNKWVICDGRPIEGGPWKGKETPDLRGAFLMGGDQRLIIGGDDNTLMKNNGGFCFKENCFENETKTHLTHSFNVTYIMKVPGPGLW